MIRLLRRLVTPLLRHHLEEVERQRDQALREAGRLYAAAQVLLRDNVTLRRRLHLLEPTQLIPAVSLEEIPTVAIQTTKGKA